MKRFMRTFAVLSLALTLQISQSLAAVAKAPDSDCIVNAINDYKGKADIAILGTGEAKVSASVKTDIGSSTEMTVYLQKKNATTGNWTTVTSWKTSSKKANTLFETTYRLSKRGTYRAKMSATVKRDGKSETVHATSKTIKY